MSNSVGQIGLDLHVNQGGFNEEINNISNNASSMLGGAFKKVGIAISTAFALSALTKFSAGCISLASDLNEVQNVVDVTFGSMSNQIAQFSSTAIGQFGLSELSAKKFSSTMGAMLKSSGITGQAMTNMSLGITGLAGDMASFYNLKPEEAFNKIRAGISGETEPLKQLGVNMSVANMEAYALSQGITTSYQNMSQASQSLLRYNYLLSVTKDAQGDFARTSGTWANQVRILSEQFNSLKGTLGQGFINMLTPILTGLNILISKLQIAAQYFNAFTVMLFGSAAAKGQAAGEAFSKAAGSASKLASSTDKIGAASKKAAADVKGSLGAFDQLNVIGEKSSSGDDSGGIGDMGGNGDVPVLDVPSVNTDGIMSKLEPFKKMLDDLIKPLKDINFEPLVAAFGRLGEALKPIGKSLFEGLEWAYFNILVPLASWTIQSALPAFLDVLSGALKVLNPLIDALKPLGLWLFENFLKPIAEFTGGVIVSVLTELGKALSTIGDWMTNNQEAVKVITGLVVGFFAAWKLIELMSFIQLSGGVVEALSLITKAIWAATGAKIADKIETMILMGMYAKDFVVSIGKSVVALGGQLVQWGLNTVALIANKVALVASTIAQVAMTVATGAWNVVGAIGTAVTTAFGVAVAILTSPIGLVILAIAALVAGVILLIKNWDKVKEVASNVWEGIKNTWKSAATWFSSNVIDPIAKVFKGLWNGIADGMNVMIKGINKIKVDIPDWVPLMGGKKFGFDMPLVPKLANGGLVSAPTLAMVGDNRNASTDPEVIAPLSKLRDMLGNSGDNSEIVSLLNRILNTLNNQSGDLILKIGDTEFGRIAIKSINKTQRQAGISLITT